MRSIILKNIILFLVSMGFLSAASGIYVYVIPFENIKNDAAISWLSEGLADMVTTDLDRNDNIYLKNQSGLEEVMANRSLLLQQKRGTKNLLILGKYARALNKISITVQLIDISSWDELDQRKISGDYNNLKVLNSTLAELVHTMLNPYVPAQKASPYPALVKGKGLKKKPVYGNQATKRGKSINLALDNLEEKMDIAIGVRHEADVFEPREVGSGEWVMDVSMDPHIADNPQKRENTGIMVDVINTLMENPYRVNLSRPAFEFNPENRKEFNVVLKVDYSLKGHLIKDMLSSMPYSGLKQEGSLTIFYFNRDRYNFPENMTEKIKLGKHRTVPVIQFLDKNDLALVVLVDSPEIQNQNHSSKEIIFEPFHFFSPLIEYTIGGWSLQVALETVNIPAEYSFNIDISKARKINRVSLKFIPEDEVRSYLKNIL
ncbi:MAG: hypothetical protein V3S48_04775 [Candidatus Neomarinimicrobiota bacterium]